MIDLYLSNRNRAKDYHSALSSEILQTVQPESLPKFDLDKGQSYYLEFKNRIIKIIDRETTALQKELTNSENSHLLLLKNTYLVDAIIQASFNSALHLLNETSHVNHLKENDLPIAIVARGGYGREEMYFRSNVEFQVVFRAGLNTEEEKLVDEFTNFFNYLFSYQEIFSTSISSGPSEINPEDQEMNTARFASFHSLLEHRFIAGNHLVYNEFKSSIKTAALFHKDEILRECLKHRTYFEIQNTVFKQEPNIKEELLRVYWAASVVRIRESMDKTNLFELLSELYSKNILSSPAFKKMQSGLNFLSRVRLFLHCHQHGSHRDELSYEVRDKITESMGYGKDVNKFFNVYFYQAVLPLKRLSRNIFWESVSFPTSQSKTLNKFFCVNSENQITFNDPKISYSWSPPTSVLELFTLVSRKNYFLAFPVIRSIESNIEQMFPLFQEAENAKAVQSYFQNIIKGKYFAKAIRYLHEFNLLENFFIPEFKNLTGLLQDIYVHIFPTDIHILAALDALNKIEIDPEVDPFLRELYQSLKNKTIIRLSVLLHDIGKGLKAPGENEELIGARAIPQILNKLGYGNNKRLVEDVAFLVEKHLMMHDLMLLDPDEDETYNMIWDLVNKDVERFKMLILLTYADRAGTKMKMSKTQIDQLKYFYQSMLYHQKRVSVPNEVQSEFFKMIRLPRDLQAQLQIYHQFKNSKDQFATEFIFKPEQSSELVVCTKDQPGLLYNISAILAFNQLSISEANIHTSKDNVFDVFNICGPSREPIAFSNFSYLQKQLKEDLRKVFVEKIPISLLYKGRTLSSKLEEKFNDIKLKIAIIGRAVKIETHDIIGTIMLETQVFSQLNMEIQRAVIHTNYGSASNIFYLRPEDVHTIIKEEKKFKNMLKSSLQPLIHNTPIFPKESKGVSNTE